MAHQHEAAIVDEEIARAARKKIDPYLIGIAWPTVLLALGCVLAFVGVIVLSVSGIIPLWLGMVLNTLVLYADQTPLHEACHGNIAGRDKRYMWLNHMVGWVAGAILLHEYRAFRYIHNVHHRNTNNPDEDPDAWIFGSNPVSVFFRCWTITLKYVYFYFSRLIFTSGNLALSAYILSMYMLFYAIMGVLSWYGYFWEVLYLWVIPHFAASFLIIFFFGYLVHPEDHEERFHNTRLFSTQNPVIAPFVNWIWFFQSHHLIHHLYPRIPFYLYPQVFRDLRPLLLRIKAPLYRLDRLIETGRVEPLVADEAEVAGQKQPRLVPGE